MKKQESKLQLIQNPVDITEEFVKGRPLSYSSMKNFKKSPRHYKHYVSKKREPATDAQLLGSVVDCLLLEPKKFERRFRLYEKFPRRSNADKLKWQNLVEGAQKDRVQLITPEVKKTAEYCIEAIKQHPEAMELIEGKRYVQHKLEWKEHSVKLPMIGYIDFDSITARGHFIVDLKTTNDASTESFCKDIIKFGYDGQGATYCRGFHKTRFEFPKYCWLAVETSEPYGVNVIHFDPKDLQIAKDALMADLRAFRKCLDENRFDEDYRFWLMDSRPNDYFRYPFWKKKLIAVEDEDIEEIQ